MTPIEDRGFRLPGCLPDVASEVHLMRPLSRIVAFGPPDVASESHVERPLIEDRGVRLPGCLPGVAAEAQLQ